jgi:hypothetical protein
MVLESRYTAAEAYLKTRHGRSLYFTYGLACLTFQKAIMSFDPHAITDCLSALEDSIKVASILKKSAGGFLTNLIPGKSYCQTSDFKSMNTIERHAELVYASSIFFRSIISIITNLNVMTMVREGMKIRSCYLIFKSCYKYIHTIFMEEGQAGFKRHSIDEYFIGGVLMGMGGFNLAFSMAPANMVKVCEIIGFSADRQFAMSCLETGARWPKRDFSMIYPSVKGRKPSAVVDFDMPPSNGTTNIQSLFCDWLLFTHHTVLSTMVPIPEADFPFAKIQLDRRLKQYPKSILYLILEARLNDTMGQMTKAEMQVISLIQMQKDWQTLVHGGIWALGFIKASQGKWREAAGCFEILSRESKWSPAVYMYLKAVCLYHADKVKYADTIFLAMRMVPSQVQKLAGGQTLPDEVCALIKFLKKSLF